MMSDTSIKLTEGNIYLRYEVSSIERNKTLTVKSRVYNLDIDTSSPCQLYIYSRPLLNIAFITIPLSTNFRLIEFTFTIPSDSDDITFLITLNSRQGTVYLDNFTINIQ